MHHHARHEATHANQHQRREWHRVAGDQTNNGRSPDEPRADPCYPIGNRHERSAGCQIVVRPVMLQRVADLMSRNRHSGQRLALEVVLRKAHHPFFGIVVITHLGDLDANLFYLELLE